MEFRSRHLSSQDVFLAAHWLSHFLWLPGGVGRKACRSTACWTPGDLSPSFISIHPQSPSPLIPSPPGTLDLVEVLECPAPSPLRTLSPACLLPCSLGSSLALPPSSLLGFLQASLAPPLYVLIACVLIKIVVSLPGALHLGGEGRAALHSPWPQRAPRTNSEAPGGAGSSAPSPVPGASRLLLVLALTRQ